MLVDERARRLLTDDLLRVHGEEVTDILMAHLPPVGWADVATKQDLGNLATVLRAEITGLRGDVTGEIAGLRGDVTGEMARLRADVSGQIIRQTYWVIGTFVTCMFGTAGLVLGVLQLAR